ncbi:MAG: short-chain dehydrogenase, partial [Verrucomicrobiota bacterium]|nr:short-chain dehydrogenase [Verrucomicrobiota bacterium]
MNAICPGWVDTKMAVKAHEDFARDMKEPYEKV